MSNIAQELEGLAAPDTLIEPDAVMVALPAACMRSPVLLAPPGTSVLVMFALFAVIETSAKGGGAGPVMLAALTALPPGLTTMTPGSSTMFRGVLFALKLMLLV